MTMNMMIYPLGMLGFYVCGFAFMFGGVGTPGAGSLGTCTALSHEWTPTIFGKPFGLLGTHGFFLTGDTYDAGLYCLFLFQMVFMDTTATIPTGAAAERWKFSAFMLYGAFIGTVMYPVFGNWVWGGGWLSQLGVNFGLGHGHVDFAGSSVVHLQGGVIALIFAWLIGPRIGKYNKDGSINPMPAHNIPMAILGTLILAFGWFGFNPGSTLSGTDLRIAVVATNTMLASATGCLAACLWMWWRKGKPDPSMACNGMLAGLVAITCPCAFVTGTGACALGLVSGFLVVESVFFFDKIGVDDPVGAISVHGVNGAWGCLSLGLFGDGAYGQGWNGVHGYMVNGVYKMMDPSMAPTGSTEVGVIGLFYGGGWSQLVAEFVGVVTCFVTLSVISIIVYKIVEVTIGNRVSEETEVEGLDIPEVSLVGILDADKEGFLRSERSLIQTIGRAARNLRGKVLLYADKETDSIREAVGKTRQRRTVQAAFNQEHGITPRSASRAIMEMQVAEPIPKKGQRSAQIAAIDLKKIDDIDSLRAAIEKLRVEMRQAAADLEFEKAAALRDKARELEQLELQMR